MELEGRDERTNCKRVTSLQRPKKCKSVSGRKIHAGGPLKYYVLYCSNRKRPARPDTRKYGDYDDTRSLSSWTASYSESP